jgi:septal ring factor EnvC (AmiA/AmiB activator)
MASPNLGGIAAVVALTIAAAFLPAVGAGAQQTSPPGSAREVEKVERQRELEILRDELARTKKAEAKRKAEIDAIKSDRKKFAQTLLDTAAHMRAIETKLAATEARLAPLDARETELRRSLDSRRAVLADVLAALTRLGRQPAPALILRPEDALESVRSAILLGAVIPKLRAEAEALAKDLAELARIRREIAAERDALHTDRAALDEERQRIAALIDERQHRQVENEKALESERTRSLALSKQVESVGELVTRMEKEIASAARAAAAARRQADAKPSLAALSDPGRITPAIPFAQTKGRLPLPVTGTRLREFGAPDELGGSQKGLLVAARPGAQVIAPCDGWVVYTGLFRSYGRLLIINAGGGYHVLLAGMERITVDLGQFVLTGEPVAVMGNGPRMASATEAGSPQPSLYVEFRKDGNSIDPSPWWAVTEEEKVRG